MKPWKIVAGVSGGVVVVLAACFAYLVYAMSGVVMNMPLDYPENEEYDI